MGNDTLRGGAGHDWLTGGAGADTLDGGAGEDTVSYEGSNAGLTVNLRTGEASGGHATGDSIRGFEHIVGSAYADTLTGDGGSNFIRGGAGADVLEGGDGDDTVSYAESNAGVAVNLRTGEASGGHATGDSIRGFEHIVGSAYADTLTGDGGSNFILGSGGADTLDGGDGDDTVSYVSSNSGVAVNLRTGEVSGGHATGDSIRGFEHVIGSFFYADTLIGDDGDNTIEGGGGADTLDGGGGEDTVSYEGSYEGVTVNLSTGEVYGGHASGDSIRVLSTLSAAHTQTCWSAMAAATSSRATPAMMCWMVVSARTPWTVATAWIPFPMPGQPQASR